MQLLLIRHAEPVRLEVVEGRADPGLHERGRAQAALLAEYLVPERLDAIWCSPLLRARETAAPLATGHGLDVVVDDDLAEFDRGASEYVPLEELKASNDDRWTAMVEGRLTDFDGDPLVFRDTIVEVFERIVAAHPGQNVAVVCHGGVINTYLGHVLGIRRALWFEPRYASIHRVAASRSGIRTMLTVNEHPFLRGLEGF